MWKDMETCKQILSNLVSSRCLLQDELAADVHLISTSRDVHVLLPNTALHKVDGREMNSFFFRRNTFGDIFFIYINQQKVTDWYFSQRCEKLERFIFRDDQVSELAESSDFSNLLI